MTASGLERLISRSHKIRLFGHRYHPYFIAADCAVLASLGAAYALTRHFQGVSFVGFLGVFFLMIALYRLFLLFKRRILKIPSRSFLQDTVLFLLPVYVLTSFLVGYPLRLALDLAGVIFPVYGCIVRIGCFLGGCCYGIPWAKGVLYPNEIFHEETGCRGYHPGENPNARVFPIQLVESAGLLAISALIFAVLWRETVSRGIAMPLFLLCYSLLRLILDVFRRSSVRPRIGPFSEAQVFSLGVAVLSGVVLFFLTRVP